MIRRGALRGIALVVGALSLPAEAQLTGYVHVVQEGETFSSIVQLYYGDPMKEEILARANGFFPGDGHDLRAGMHLQVPSVRFHRVVAGETWDTLAQKFYGDVRRSFALRDANLHSSGEVLDVGTELLVPYPLRHVASQGESMRRIGEIYFGSDSRAARVLGRFNPGRPYRLSRGDTVLVPLGDLALSESGRRRLLEQTGREPASGQARDRQRAIDAQLPALLDHVKTGRYAEAVSLGNRLLGSGELMATQVVSVQRELAVSYVALGREDLAIQAFAEALRLQPAFELDHLRTSPTVRVAFDAAKARTAVPPARVPAR